MTIKGLFRNIRRAQWLRMERRLGTPDYVVRELESAFKARQS